MKKYKFVTLFIVIALSFSSFTFANNNLEAKSSSKFFASNNCSEIDLPTAFNKLRSQEQQALKNETLNLMRKEQVEQGKFVDLLGVYRMTSDQNITADNSEIFIPSPHQKLSSEKVFKIAKELAISLKQESVAIFIPSKQSKIGETVLKLKSHAYTIDEITKRIHKKLPVQYNQAFSLRLNNTCSNFDNATVSEVEWLGVQIKPAEVKKLFPQEQVISYYGKAYLIYKNGRKKQL